MPLRLCTPAETKLCFTSLYDSKGEKNRFLRKNINCGRSSWPSGCDPGWACSVGSNPVPGNNGTIPLRTTNCQPCCEGFFCPRGLTCMLPCPLGAYCPRATMNSATDLCDPYGYQITLNSTNGCGGADAWADFGSTQQIFCPAGYHCPTTTSKVSCSRGHFCRLGSTTENKCIFKGSCKENEENENINIWGYSLLGAIGVLTIYGLYMVTIRVCNRHVDVHPMAHEMSESAVPAAQSPRLRSEIIPSVIIDISRPSLKVEFKNLTLTLGKKKLLRYVTGKLLPGRITAVMGPSGAGKTTFLNAVAGKVTGCKMTGSVLVNGEHRNIRCYKKIIGFVPQDNVVHGNLTVENLLFSANCRLPASMSRHERLLIVERVIVSLDLQGVRNSIVGTVEKRGISGGQRKRVNVGIELVIQPSLLILDEPTSGLDSSSSQLLLKALRQKALEGVNICAVIHQPSYTLYNMFDDLILLAKGGLIVYNGPVKTIKEFFEPLGIHVPGSVNPPDHYIDILEGIVKLDSGINVKHLPVHWMQHKGYEVPSDMKDDPAMGGKMSQNCPNRSISGSTSHCLPGVSNTSDKLLLHLFHYRVMKQRWRERGQLVFDLLILAVAGLFLGKFGKLNDSTFGITGFTFSIIAFSLLCKVAALRSFSSEQLQYRRERESGMSSLAYFLARDTVDLFSAALKPMIYLSMLYFFNNPRSSFRENYMILFALFYCVTGIGYTFAICFSLGPAMLCSALTPVVLTLLSTERTTPTFLKILSYPNWALEGFIVANAKRYHGVWLITRCGLLFESGFNIHNYNLCIIVLVMYGIFFRFAAFMAMIFLKKMVASVKQFLTDFF